MNVHPIESYSSEEWNLIWKQTTDIYNQFKDLDGRIKL
jgi:hypothetical protein